MRKNSLKQKLLHESAFGTWIMTNSLDNAEILAHTGTDFIMIDAEHGSMDIETAGRMVSIIRGTHATPLIRVAGNEVSLIKRALDTGVSGVMIPMVNTKEEAEHAVRSCKYPPVGIRGIGAGRAVLFGARTLKNLRIIIQKRTMKCWSSFKSNMILLSKISKKS